MGTQKPYFCCSANLCWGFMGLVDDLTGRVRLGLLLLYTCGIYFSKLFIFFFSLKQNISQALIIGKSSGPIWVNLHVQPLPKYPISC